MNAEQLQIPVAVMNTPEVNTSETEYALTADGTVVEAEDLQEVMQ